MSIGQAYSHILTLRERKALQASCNIFIDHAFEEISHIKEPKDILETEISSFLPERYLYRYTPLFLKKFAVCLITVAWKLAEPQHMPLSSLAEELAAWAIVEQAKVVLETEELASEETSETATDIFETDEHAEGTHEDFEAFIDEYFEDLDLEYLFDNEYDGIDETELAQIMGISSLALD